MIHKPAGLPLLALLALGLACAGACEAASPKKRARMQNRIGPYGAGFIGQSTFPGDHSDNEQTLEDILAFNGIPYQNLDSSTEDTDIGYHAAFGFRFHRYMAAELGLVRYGELVSRADGELDIGAGFTPAEVTLGFSTGGVMFSALGVLPIGERFEVFGRLGLLFARVESEFAFRVEGDSSISGSAGDDTQEPVYGVGFGWNISQVYSVRAEYQMIRDLGTSRSGKEDVNSLSLGILIRF